MESALSRVRTHKLVRGTAAGEAAARQLTRISASQEQNELLHYSTVHRYRPIHSGCPDKCESALSKSGVKRRTHARSGSSSANRVAVDEWSGTVALRAIDQMDVDLMSPTENHSTGMAQRYSESRVLGYRSTGSSYRRSVRDSCSSHRETGTQTAVGAIGRSDSIIRREKTRRNRRLAFARAFNAGFADCRLRG